MGGLSGFTKAGYMAGGVSKGIESGLRSLAEQAAREESSKRTDIMGQELDIRKQAAQRTEEEYQRGIEPIPIETARKGFSTKEESDYHEGLGRAMGVVRKDESGNEFIMRKDAATIMGMMKSKELQEDKDNYIRGILQEKVAKAEKDAKDQPELKAQHESIKKRLYDHEARMGLNKTTAVPKGSRLVDSTGKVVLDADDDEKSPKTLNEYLTRQVNEGKMTIDEALAKNKKGGEG